MTIHFLLVLGHIIGTVLGVGGATFIEVNLNQALRDNKMDEVERAFMGISFTITRIGMFIGFITGVGFIIEYYLYDQMFRLMDGVFWAKMLIFLIIIINAYLLHKHKVGLYWGSAFSFISWWTAFVLGTFLSNGVKFFPGNVPVSFISIMFVYGILIVLGAYILHVFRERNKLAQPTV